MGRIDASAIGALLDIPGPGQDNPRVTINVRSTDVNTIQESDRHTLSSEGYEYQHIPL